MILKRTFKRPDEQVAMACHHSRGEIDLMNIEFCRKDTLFNNFDSYSKIVVPCLCCDICKKSCNCSSCENNYQSFVL